MIVSISRELGAGGASVGEALAAALDGVLLDERSIVDELSRRLPLPHDYLAKTLEERPPTLGEILIAHFARASDMSDLVLSDRDVALMDQEEIIEAIRTVVLEHAAKGNVVVIGYGGMSLLGWRPQGTAVLGILLHAHKAWRIQQVARRFAIDVEEAERRIAQIDEARKRYQKYYFKSDVYDAKRYDLVLNTEVLGLDVAIELATLAVKRLNAAPV